MNQTCKVCGEPAAGFHFGAFTCEGCKSFFGRSYNNLSSISECKNNGECVINKKNRTACKACRLRKCLMVGMSKSGSRYGRRSNWFKIHCLLQEQQQAAAAAAGGPGGNPKSPTQGPPPPGLSLPFHPGFPMGLHRPPTNDLMLLGLEEYTKLPGANSTVSSPDSHNSDSSIDITDRSQLLKKFSEHNNHHVSPTTTPTGANSKSSTSSGHSAPSNKELFLPLPFSALSSMPMMPPPSFLPQSHLLFSGYHPALYSHHQGLLKPVDQHLMNSSLAFHHQQQQQQQQQQQNNNSRFTPNHNHPMFGNPHSLAALGGSGKHDKAAEELTKRFYLDAVLKSQMSPRNGLTKSSSPLPAQHHIQRQTEDDEDDDEPEEHLSRVSEDQEIGDIDKNNNSSSGEKKHQGSGKSKSTAISVPVGLAGKDDHAMLNAMTPPRSPINSSHGSGDKQKHNSTPKAGAELRKRSSTDVSPASHQDNPIDLSMKTSSSTASDENRSNSSVAGSDLDVDERLSDSCTEPPPVKSSHPRLASSPLVLNGQDTNGSDAEDETTEYDQAIKRMKFQGTTPLDLTTKV